MDYGLRLVAFLLNLIGILLLPIFKVYERLRKAETVPPITDNLLLIPTVELAAKIRTQQVKSERVVRAYIDRIKLVNPVINAVVEDRFEDALKDAQRADQLCESSDPAELKNQYPLLGVPFTVKESCGLQGFSQSVGSIPRKGVKAAFDGAVVANLKAVGAIPLLISANPEFCISWECNSLLNGACCNPYNSRHSSGGSSGGEGALIGAGASLFGVGSDIAGSIRVPSLFNGIFGHKPTGELLSTKGHFPHSADAQFQFYLQTGPMCRYASDLPLLLKIMAGEKYKILETEKNLDLLDIKVCTIDFYGSKLNGSYVSKDIIRSINDAASYLKTIGMQVKKIELKADINETLEGSLANLVEMKDIPDVLLHPDDPKVQDNLIAELSKYIFGDPKYSFASLVFSILKDTGGFMTAESRTLHQEKFKILRKELLDVLGDDSVLLFPTMHCTAFKHHTSYVNMPGVMFTMMFNVMGFPGTHVPMGLSKDGLPIGFQVVAAPFKDKLCLTVANDLEKKFGGWVPPS